MFASYWIDDFGNICESIRRHRHPCCNTNSSFIFFSCYSPLNSFHRLFHISSYVIRLHVNILKWILVRCYWFQRLARGIQFYENHHFHFIFIIFFFLSLSWLIYKLYRIRSMEGVFTRNVRKISSHLNMKPLKFCAWISTESVYSSFEWNKYSSFNISKKKIFKYIFGFCLASRPWKLFSWKWREKILKDLLPFIFRSYNFLTAECSMIAMIINEQHNVNGWDCCCCWWYCRKLFCYHMFAQFSDNFSI